MPTGPPDTHNPSHYKRKRYPRMGFLAHFCTLGPWKCHQFLRDVLFPVSQDR